MAKVRGGGDEIENLICQMQTAQLIEGCEVTYYNAAGRYYTHGLIHRRRRVLFHHPGHTLAVSGCAVRAPLLRAHDGDGRIRVGQALDDRPVVKGVQVRQPVVPSPTVQLPTVSRLPLVEKPLDVVPLRLEQPRGPIERAKALR